MSEPTYEQHMAALRRAHEAGDEEAARKIAALARQAQEREAQAGADPGNIAQQIGRGAGNALMNTGRGFLDFSLAPIDALTGGWEAPERARAAIRGEGQAATQNYEQQRTGVSDAARLVTDIGMFAIPAAGAAKVPKAIPALSSMAGRIGTQSGAAMATDAMMQRGRGQDIDPGQVAMTGAFAGGGELAAPVIGRAIRWGVEKFKGNNPIELGRAIAKQAGIDNISDDLARELAKGAEEVRAGAKPEAVIAEREFGFKLTRGQKTGRRDFIDQEDMLRQRDTRAGERINQVDDFNREQLEGFVSRETGGLSSPQTAVDDIQAAVRGARDKAKRGADEAWQFARSSDLVVSGQLADDFSRNVAEAFESSGRIVNENIADSARSAIDSIDNVLRTAVDESGGIDFKKIEEARKMFSTNYGAMKDPASKAAFRIAREQFDNTLDGLTEATILSGNIEDIQRLKNATGISREVFRRFTASGKDDYVGKVVERILKSGNSDDLTDALLGAQQVSHRAGANFAKAIKRTLGDDAPELGRLKQAVLLKAATRKTGDSLTMREFSNNLKDMLRNRRELLGELFTSQEVARLERMTQALDAMTFKPPGRGKSSQTTERLWRWMDQVAGGGVLGIVPRMARNFREGRISRAAVNPITPPTPVPLLPATAGATQSNRQ